MKGAPTSASSPSWKAATTCPAPFSTSMRKRESCAANSVVFGPGDLFCSVWHLLALAGIGEEDVDAAVPLLVAAGDAR